MYVATDITVSTNVAHGPVPEGKLLTGHSEKNIEIESKCLDRHTYLVNQQKSLQTTFWIVVVMISMQFKKSSAEQ